MNEYSNWCKSLVRTIKVGGKWAVPRSGLVFTKENEERLVLTETLTGFDPAWQAADLETIKQEFAKAGIKVLG